MTKMLTVFQVAEILGFSAWTIRKWCRSGKIPARSIGGEWRIHPNTVEAMLRPNNSPEIMRQLRGIRRAKRGRGVQS